MFTFAYKILDIFLRNVDIQVSIYVDHRVLLYKFVQAIILHSYNEDFSVKL